jgi:putative ABC transport system substrate-binding protein
MRRLSVILGGRAAIHRAIVALTILVFSDSVLTLAAYGQQAETVHRIGLLGTETSYPSDDYIWAPLLEGLRELGYAEGRNLVIERQFAQGKVERLPDLASELVRLKVNVIVTSSTPAAIAAKRATVTIPIVVVGSATPVEAGLVRSLARPGGNVTGLTDGLGPDFVGKQLQLLKQVAPKISRVAVFLNSTNHDEAAMFNGLQGGAQALGMTLVLVDVKTANQFDRRTFAAEMAQARVEGFWVNPTLLNWEHRSLIVDFATMHRLPAVYGDRTWVDTGGLMAYSTSWPALRRRAAVYVDKILKGAKPADLPVEEPTKFELVINLKTAKTLGLTIPPSILARADEVIE